jgi:hypothetical protein
MAKTSKNDPSSKNTGGKGELRREDVSLFIAIVFAGLGCGFVLFWLTLSFLYSFVLSFLGIPVIWFAAKSTRGNGIMSQAIIIYIISVAIGIGVGFASSFGTGVPVAGL